MSLEIGMMKKQVPLSFQKIRSSCFRAKFEKKGDQRETNSCQIYMSINPRDKNREKKRIENVCIKDFLVRIRDAFKKKKMFLSRPSSLFVAFKTAAGCREVS